MNDQGSDKKEYTLITGANKDTLSTTYYRGVKEENKANIVIRLKLLQTIRESCATAHMGIYSSTQVYIYHTRNMSQDVNLSI